MKRSLRIVLVLGLVAAVAFAFLVVLPSDRAVDIVSTPAGDTANGTPNDPVGNGYVGNSSVVGTAYVVITLRFMDGTVKVLTSQFSTMTVFAYGKAVRDIEYTVNGKFEAGEPGAEVVLTNIKTGLFITRGAGTGYWGQNIQNLPVPDKTLTMGVTGGIASTTVTALTIESYLTGFDQPAGSYTLKFFTEFSWSSISADHLASISGPNIPVNVQYTTSGDNNDPIIGGDNPEPCPFSVIPPDPCFSI